MTDSVRDAAQEAVGEKDPKGMWAWTVLRLLLGWAFLWGFLDKFFGLGFSTCRAEDSSSIDYVCDAAMIKGGSPTYGFLNFATEASHTGSWFDWMAPSAPDSINLADVLFMAALLLGGICLMLGFAVRTAGVGGALLMAFMFFAGDVWPENNPINSSHVIEFVAYLGIAYVGAGRFSIQRWMSDNVPLIGKIP
jgi:thiosulfate dehydrogenase [quinone] large subunit